MSPNPAFRATSDAQNLEFARSRGFGALCINGIDGPLVAHVPFEMTDAGGALHLHLARSNAIARANLPCPALMAVSGPDGYISPDWYGIDDQVPTWNYIAVHLRGILSPLPADRLEDHLNAVSTNFESQMAPKPVWHSSKMSEGVMARMMRAIIPFQLQIKEIQGTWKLGQNKTPQARAGAIAGLRALGMDGLADHMEQVR